MQASAELRQKIIEFLKSIAASRTEDSRRAFVYSAGLDARLQDRIDFGGSSEQFWQLCVAELIGYGRLNDGRDALIAVLNAAKEMVGLDRRKECDRLIQAMTAAEQAADVFISYRHQEPDSALAHDCAEALKAKGHRVFIDTKIGWGADWVSRIRAALEQTEFLLVLLSHEAAQSDMVAEEVVIAKELARHKGVPIILPVRVRYSFSEPLPYRLATELYRIHQISWNDAAETPTLIDRLLTAIANRASWPGEIAETPQSTGSSRQLAPRSQFDPRDLIRPGGALDIETDSYVRRDADDQVLAELKKKRGIVTLKGASQTGKTSLMMRVYASARQELQSRTAFIDFQALPCEHFESLNTIWLAMAVLIAEQLELDDWDESRWKANASYERNFSRFLSRMVFDRDQTTPLLLCLDKVDRVFNSRIKTEFFASVRAFYNKGAYDQSWKKVRWLLATSSDPEFFIEDISQSPFNIGLRVDLMPFTRDETAELARHCGLIPEPGLLAQMSEYVGGHPYLVHLLLYQLALEPGSGSSLFDVRTASRKIFRDHLHRYLIHFQQETELANTMKSVIQSFGGCKDARLRSRLEAAGLVRWTEDDQVAPLCRLYAEFFGKELP
ncbi:MAG: toll/interleukin-1 receptor domain-containing protein [Gammaproteobacteria bacterium]|nr:toll/interleukin-1 receptor domain-containing protein [Gammaproteobacteria bacterium]